MSPGRRSTRSTRKILRDLYDPSAPVRWAAVQELGDWAEARWPESSENVRDLVRRLAWSLNDESGATGWGAPEAMAEILARIPDLRIGFASLYPAYLSHEDVYLGHEVLDTGSLWALGRLGPDAPFGGPDLVALIRPFLSHEAPEVRGTAAWATGRLGLTDLRDDLVALDGDPSPVFLLVDGEVDVRTLEELARDALAAL
ncbi:MAG: DVU0298 family protein [Planctomycetota bacterium]